MARKGPMLRSIAFLRGINVGGHRVKMDVLRAHFAALGFADVATFIASGNVIFAAPASDPAALEARIEAHLKAELGYEVATFLRTPADLASIVASNPFPEESDITGHSLHVGFLRQAPGAEAARAIEAFRTPRDEFRIVSRELFWLCRGKITDSLAPWPQLGKGLLAPSTMRNMKTVRQITMKYPPT